MVNIGIIGYGYWGPNIVRNFLTTRDARVKVICDKDENALTRAKKLYDNIELTTELDKRVFSAPDIDAVAIITPVNTHYYLAKKALEHGKHIFVEKPFTATSAQAHELIELAGRKNLKIMVDHTFIFTGAVKKIREIIDKNILGGLQYYDSTRINLGLFQHDVNVIWDLAPHDFSILDYVVNTPPVAISAFGIDHFNTGHENIAYITAFFNNSLIAHFNVNWLSPVKIRTTIIGGDKKMLLWNDIELDEKIKVYDRGVTINTKEGIYKLLIDYRSGDMWAPILDRTEALKVEAQYFVDCIINNIQPVNDGLAGLRVVRMLETSDLSLKNQGRPIEL